MIQCTAKQKSDIVNGMDNYPDDLLQAQLDRVKRIVGKILPGDIIEFNSASLPNLISFVVRDHRNQQFLIIPVSGDYTPSELAAWSDDRLQKAIKALCGPRLPSSQ
jgi:hypothetical protein